MVCGVYEGRGEKYVDIVAVISLTTILRGTKCMYDLGNVTFYTGH